MSGLFLALVVILFGLRTFGGFFGQFFRGCLLADLLELALRFFLSLSGIERIVLLAQLVQHQTALLLQV